MTETINADTISGFPLAKHFYLTAPGGTLVVNLVTADGRTIRQEVVKEHLASFTVDAIPHVVRV